MSHLNFDEAFAKDDPAVGDVHIGTALGNGDRRRRKAKLIAAAISQDTKLPVTGQSMAAQALSGHGATLGKAFEAKAQVCKVDESHGLVLGFAIVCKRDGIDYYDLQDDHIPEDAMLSAAVDFMQHSGVAKEMHVGGAKGTVLFAFPLTADIAKAFGIETSTTGLMIAMKPSDPAVLGKFRDGIYTGFSIGGNRMIDEEVADD